MKWMIRIVLLPVWIAGSQPCMHAVAADRHEHDHASGVEMCASSDHECHCHSCETIPCSEKMPELFQRLSSGSDVAFTPSITPLFILSEGRPPPASVFRESRGVLPLLKTVQLLI